MSATYVNKLGVEMPNYRKWTLSGNEQTMFFQEANRVFQGLKAYAGDYAGDYDWNGVVGELHSLTDCESLDQVEPSEILGRHEAKVS